MHDKRGDESAIRELREVWRLLRAGDFGGARSACLLLNARAPQFADAWLAACHVALALKQPADALAAIERAAAIDPANVRYRLQRAQCFLALGQRGAALDAARAAADAAGKDAAAWDAVGTLRSFASDQRGALEAYDRAVALAPEALNYLAGIDWQALGLSPAAAGVIGAAIIGLRAALSRRSRRSGIGLR